MIYQVENIMVSHCIYISVETLNLTKIQQWDCLLQCKTIVCNIWIGHKNGRIKKLIAPPVSDFNFVLEVYSTIWLILFVSDWFLFQISLFFNNQVQKETPGYIKRNRYNPSESGIHFMNQCTTCPCAHMNEIVCLWYTRCHTPCL